MYWSPDSRSLLRESNACDESQYQPPDGLLATIPSPIAQSANKGLHKTPSRTLVAGLTGRKIIVDTYGGAAPHGGGAFSGKDPTKVDRSAAYAARYLAKNVVAAGLADKCTIQLSYAIGVSKPLSVYVNTAGTGKVEDSRLETVLPEVMDLSPRGIRQALGLNAPIYAATAAYGHFGRVAGEAGAGSFSWEATNLKDAILKAV